MDILSNKINVCVAILSAVQDKFAIKMNALPAIPLLTPVSHVKH